MPLVGVNNEPLLERAIFGIDGSAYRVVKVDTDGNIVAAIKASQAIEVTQDTYADLNATVIPNASNVFRGFLGVVEEQISETSLPSGSSSKDGTAVPAGEIWNITQVTIQYSGTVPTRIWLLVAGLAGGIQLLNVNSPVSGTYYSLPVNVYAQEADKVRIWVSGATLNDDLNCRYCGYKFTAP